MIEWLKDNPFIDTAIVAVVVILGFFGGCQVTVQSLLDPNVKVSRLELENELQTILNTAEIRFRQIDREETLRRELLNHAMLIGQAGTVNLFGLIPIAMSILGAGAVADNVRKRKIIRNNTRTYVETAKKNNSTSGDTA